MISRGVGEGEALVTRDNISFLGGVNPVSGLVVERGHELEGKCVKGSVLIFPKGKGSTVGSWIIMRLVDNNAAPAAIINVEAEPIVAAGAILGDIPLMDKLEEDPTSTIRTGDHVKVDAVNGRVEVTKQ